MAALYILIGLLLLGLGVGLVQYNKIVGMRQLVRNGWSDIDVYLKRRAELIPNLVTAVKAYASHEQTVLTAVTEARAQASALAGPTHEKAAAETSVGQALFKVIAIAEDYPELKANANFLDLQRELSETERHIASARQYFNACVRDYNILLEAFPSNLIAGTMGVRHEEFFELATPLERNAPSVAPKQ